MKLKSAAFRPSVAIELQYRRELLALINAMIKDYKGIIRIYSDKKEQVAIGADAKNTWLTTDVQARLDKLGKKWSKKFAEFADKKGKSFVDKILKQSDTQLLNTLKGMVAEQRLSLMGNSIPQPLQQSLNAHVAENISLIKSIPEQYLDRVQGSVTRIITTGGSIKQLTEEIMKYNGMSRRRAALIANDQTRKVFNSINLRRFEQIGIKKAEWVHSGGGKEPRPYHIRKWDGVSGKRDGHPNGLNGFIFNVDEPPVIDEKTGIRGLPAQLVNCRCVMRAVIDE